MRKIETFGQLRDALNAGEIVHWCSVAWTLQRCNDQILVVSCARVMQLSAAILADPHGFFVADDDDYREARSDANPRA